MIIDKLPGLPFNEIYKLICNQYSEYSFKFLSNESKLELFDGSFLVFFKYIFDANYQEILNLEFALRRYLNFSSFDMDTTPFPECRIMFNKFDKDTQQKKDSNVE